MPSLIRTPAARTADDIPAAARLAARTAYAARLADTGDRHAARRAGVRAERNIYRAATPQPTAR